MRTTETDTTSLVLAAQAGERRALDQLVAEHLPLVYTIVRRGLDGDAGVDDVVQDTMLRALRDLRALRTPESFRAWLAAITLRQIGTYQRRLRGRAERAVELPESPDPGADVEDLSLLRVELSAQRRQVTVASRWLDPGDRALLSLWWLETAGRLTRPELAQALGVRVTHAAVRVQRMRTQLEASRTVVAALEAEPGCDRLDAVLAGWDGRPSPLWRKRIARHARSCPACLGAAAGLVPTERLLAGSALLPVPVGLTGALTGSAGLAATAVGASAGALSGAAGGVGVKLGLLGQLAQALVAHQVAAVATVGVVVAGAAATTVHWSAPPTPAVRAAPSLAPAATAVRPSPATAHSSPATAVPAPAAPAGSPSASLIASPAVGRPLGVGPASLASVNEAGYFATTDGDFGILAPVGPVGDKRSWQAATFQVIPGRADPRCFSFRARNGRYLRHSSWRLRLDPDDGSALFRGDATFCARAGAAAGSVSLESSNYPSYFVRHRDNQLWVDQSDGTAAFRADSSFLVLPPLAA